MSAEPVVPGEERPAVSNAALIKEARDWANVLEFQSGKVGSDYGLHAPTFADLLRKLADALARPALPAPEPPTGYCSECGKPLTAAEGR